MNNSVLASNLAIMECSISLLHSDFAYNSNCEIFKTNINDMRLFNDLLKHQKF